MDIADLQRELQTAGFEPGLVDDRWGPRTRGALMDALRGNPAPVPDIDVTWAATAYELTPAHIRAVLEGESGGRGFDAVSRLPLILFEPHVFSRLTDHRFDAIAPTVSYPHRGERPYPRTQDGRYEQLMTAAALAPEPALQAASWGLFQVCGFNAAASGFSSTWAFVRAMANGEGAQLNAFLRFIAGTGLLAKLRAKDWAGFARGYNGPGYAANKYDTRLAEAYRRAGGL